MEYEKIRDALEEFVLNELYEKRRAHTLGVRDTALKLCEKYGADPLKAEIAALGHDMFRGLRGEALNEEIKRLGLPDKYLNDPNLAHSKIAAVRLKEDYGVTDEDILNAVSYHTTGRRDMSLLEKVIYLADGIEPNRTYPGVDRIRQEAETSLDGACLMAMQGTIEYVTSQGTHLDEDTKEAADHLLQESKENK